MELAVWKIPSELADSPDLPALLECCEETWREHILGKLAVPEVNSCHFQLLIIVV